MKKITLIATLFVTTTLTHAQKVYDFTGSANPGNWIHASTGISATPSAQGLVFEFGNNTPRIDITRAADPFNVSVGTHMVVTLINNNTEVGSFSGFFDKNGVGQSGTQFLGFQTGMVQASSPGAGVEATYVFELTSANYLNDPGNTTGNDTNSLSDMEYIGIRFRNAAGANLTGTSAANGNIILKRIEIVNAGSIQKTSYNFASDNLAGFEGLTGATISKGTNTLNLVGDNTNVGPKFGQSFYSVNASANSYAHVTVSGNASNADEVRFQFVDAMSVAQNYTAVPLTIGNVIDLPLSSKPEWTGNLTNWRIVFSNSGGAAINTGLIQVSSVSFDNNATLSTSSFNTSDVSFYPNPANNTIFFNGNSKVVKASIFDITGKQVLESNAINNNQLDVSNLKTGLYLLNIQDSNNNNAVKKLIIK